MIKFSEKRQSFFDISLDYAELPNDLINVTSEQHFELLDKINDGYHVFSDLSLSEKKPSPFHTWGGATWVDNRTAEEIEIERLKQFRPLTRRQFKLALLENGLLDQIENSISAIEDDQTRARIQIEYSEATEFHRTSDSVAYMCQLLGLTDERVNQMWESALTL